MNFAEIRQSAKIYSPAIKMDLVFSLGARRKVFSILSWLAWISLFAAILTFLSQNFGFSEIYEFRQKMTGVFVLVFSLWTIVFLVNSFYYSFFFKGLPMRLPEKGDENLTKGKNGTSVSFTVASIVYSAREDITVAFLKSKYGILILKRLGLGQDSVVEFLTSKREPLLPVIFSVPSEKVTLLEFSDAVFAEDQEFASYLARRGIDRGEFKGAALWVEEMHENMRLALRFWSKERLGAISGIGKDWSYGGAYILEKYAQDITSVSKSRTTLNKTESGEKELWEMENVLSKNSEANILLVGEDGGIKKELVYRLAAKISSGKALPAIEHKRVFLFDGNSFVTVTGNKQSFESELRKVFFDIVRSGNVIIVIENLPEFLESARTMGTDLVPLLEPFLVSPDVHVVALSSPDGFHNLLEQNALFMKLFEKIQVKNEDSSATLATVKKAALAFEAKDGLFFTFQAVAEIVRSAERYFSDGVLSDKAIDLISEIASRSISSGKKTVRKEDVLLAVESKTGIPASVPKQAEKEKLLNLEKLLKERVIGQTEALQAVANSLRRARLGLTNPNRPIGSFLFLGPTGVGKTETTKALASVFFGGEADIIRLDMSEFRTADALERLIGIFGTSRAGVLSSKLREKPYGVLLLDEFEKTSPEVLDLFLQILDEGVFSDMAGKKVNARNLIIVATSNAGSELIWEMNKAGGLPDKKNIVDDIVRRGIYKPELLNRFDGVILFRPLSREEMKAVAKIMLNRLQKRLQEKGVELVITEELVNFLAERGYDPQFGARPMNRAIQDTVEKIIAEKMLRGEISAGSKVALSGADLRS
ncbi:MAG: AAA family ATPase [bacterium]|nr:AAA family ATPase [bacterium]